MRVRNKFTHRTIVKLINAGLVALLLLSLVIPSSAQAASKQQVRTNGACDVLGSLYLPSIWGPLGGVAAEVQSLLASPQAVARSLNYGVGKTYVYDYNVTVLTEASQRSSEGTTQSDKGKTVMKAQAEVSITGRENDGTFVGQIVLNNLFVCSADLLNKQENVGDMSELETELARPLLFKQKPNGVISSVAYAADTKPQAVNLQKGVINALQTLLQEGPNTYSAAEVGGQGTYTATFNLIEQNNQLTISKSYGIDDYSNLNKQGDEIDGLELESELNQVLDGDKGVLTVVEAKDTLITGDGAAESQNQDDPVVGTFDGSTAWTTVNSSARLALGEVKDTPDLLQVAALDAVYVTGGLEPILEDTEEVKPLALDITEEDLTAEFVAFEAEANDPLKFGRILDLYDGDEGDTVFNKIVERLQANASKPDIANRYVDILTAIGTPAAQQVLTDLLNPTGQVASIAATMAISTQEQALIDLVLINSPTVTSVNTLVDLAGLNGSADQNFKDTAISVLGAAINNLSDEQPERAQSLADDLIAGLSTATTQDDIESFLDALGNAGMPSTLGKISEYTEITGNLSIANAGVVSDTEVIEAAAFNALRKIPGAAAEGILVAALRDDTQTNGTRLLIADILGGRSDLSAEGAEDLATYLANSATYTREWQRWLGNKKLGVHFPGKFTVSSVNQLYLYVDQQANGYVWKKSLPLVRGQLLSKREGNSQKFGAYLNLAGNMIKKKYENVLPCKFSKSGSLYTGSRSWQKTIKIPIVPVISIDVDVKVSINASVNYAFNGDVCELTNSSLAGQIIPQAWVGVTAEASLNIRVARGGVGINAKIMNTQIPAQARLAYNGTALNFCASIKVTTQPLSGYIYAFADGGIDLWFIKKWKRLYEGKLASFNVGGPYTYTLLDRCW